MADRAIMPVALDSNGDIVSSAEAYFYERGTTTPLTVYQDEAGTTPHASPVVANAAGVFDPVFITQGYKLDIKDTLGASLPGYPSDPGYTSQEDATGASSVTFSPITGNAATNVQAAIQTLTTLWNAVTTYGKSLIAAADAAAARGVLELSTIAAKTGSEGDIAYHTGTDWARLAKGTTGQMLLQGANVPVWGGPAGAEFIGAPVSVSASTANVDFTATDDALYESYGVYISNLRPGTDAAELLLQTSADGGSSYGTSGYTGRAEASGTATSSSSGCVLATNIGASAGEDGFSGTATIYSPHDSARKTHAAVSGVVTWQDGNLYSMVGGGRRDTAEDNDAFRLIMSAGTMESGLIQWFGIRKGS